MAMSHFVTKLFNYISRLQGLSDTSQSLNRKVFTRFYDDESSIKIRNITFDKVLNILRSERLNFKQIDLKLVLPLTNHSPLTRNINYSFFFFICSFLDFAGEITLSLFVDRGGRGGGGGGSSVGRLRDSWWGGPGFDSRCGRPLPTSWVGVSIMWPAETEVMVSPLRFVCGST